MNSSAGAPIILPEKRQGVSKSQRKLVRKLKRQNDSLVKLRRENKKLRTMLRRVQLWMCSKPAKRQTRPSASIESLIGSVFSPSERQRLRLAEASRAHLVCGPEKPLQSEMLALLSPQ